MKSTVLTIILFSILFSACDGEESLLSSDYKNAEISGLITYASENGQPLVDNRETEIVTIVTGYAFWTPREDNEYCLDTEGPVLEPDLYATATVKNGKYSASFYFDPSQMVTSNLFCTDVRRVEIHSFASLFVTANIVASAENCITYAESYSTSNGKRDLDRFREKKEACLKSDLITGTQEFLISEQDSAKLVEEYNSKGTLHFPSFTLVLTHTTKLE